MKTTIHNLKPYSPEEVEAFRQRLEAERQRADEYDEIDAGHYLTTYAVITFLVALALGGWLIYGWWQASNRLVGLG